MDASIHGATNRRITLNSWDRAAISLPFSRGAIVAGEPIVVLEQADADQLERARLTVEQRLNTVTERAYALVERRDHGRA